jgi:hypothetical protein
MNTHTCIKPSCSNTYQDNDADAYYCTSCAKANKALADKIDEQVAARPKRSRASAWQEYDQASKISAGGLQGVKVSL